MIYDLLLALFIAGFLPKLLWQKVHGKRFCTLRERFGSAPPFGKSGKRKIWMHAVSVGEVKAAQPLLRQLRQADPTACILVTTCTMAGLEEARRMLSEADLFRILPLDFSWIMRSWIRSFGPDLLLFIEGDIWPNLVHLAKKAGVKTALVSGKISERSAKRLRTFSFLAKRLYGELDLLAVQHQGYKERFESFLKRPIEISGNLKLDLPVVAMDAGAARAHFSLAPSQLAVTLSCTHAPEEKELLDALKPLWEERPDLILFLAPRHPERFREVMQILKKAKIPFCQWGDVRCGEKVVLINAMGQLPICYAASSLAIVAGSFSSQIGGHNVFEPILYGCPVLFGPHMQSQRELCRLALECGAGWQVSVSEIAAAISSMLQNADLHREQAKRAAALRRGSAKLTHDLLEKI